MNLENNKDGSMKFIPAKCPSCGGELRVPDDRDSVKCMYCGSDVILHDTSKIIVETHVDIDKALILAKEAEKGSNFEEAYRYYTMILEHDTEKEVAWMGKGFAAGMLSTFNNSRIKEAEHCIGKGLYSEEYKKPIPKEILDKGHEAIKAERESRIDPILSNIARTYYFGIGQHVSSFVTSTRGGDFERKFYYACDAIKLFSIAYSLPEDEVEKFYLLSNDWIKTEIMSLIVDIHILHVEEAVNNNWPPKTIAEIWDNTHRLVRDSILSDELANDPQIKQRLDSAFPKATKKKRAQKKEAEKKDDCFIATAAMKDRNHPYVISLRRFRDKVLLNSITGRKFVEIYYLYSPTIAQVISQHNFLRKLSLYLIVRPFTCVARFSMRQNIQNK